jgi:hypothetical protein
LATAVPEVTATATHCPERARPSAKKAAERSSIRTCRVICPAVAARAKAMDSGALREPGQTTNWRTPQRANSSTMTLAWAVDGFTRDPSCASPYSPRCA